MALTPKDPVETINITFDYTAANDKLQSAVVSVTERGSAVELPAMKASVPVISTDGKKVIIKITGGENNKQYDLKCVATTLNSGETLAIKDTLQVKIL